MIEPRTVLDYYLLLPEKYFEANQEQRSQWMLDPKRGAIVDTKNGYLYAVGDGAQTNIYVCLFKKSDGTYLIGVKTHAADSSDFTYLEFYLYQQGQWKDVSQQVLPVAINDQLKYGMPRSSTTIKVTNKRGQKLYDFIWTNGVFKLKKH